MIDEKTFQTELFSYIKSMLPANASLVDEVSDVLSISNDSAYRRIRGDKFMILPELISLCRHFNVPINELIEVSDSNMVSFSTQFLNESSNSTLTFLELVKTEMQRARKAEDAHFVFIINDLNLFQLLQVPEIAAFKFHFWGRSWLGTEQEIDKPFSVNDSISNQPLVDEIIGHYLKIDTTELFSSDALVSATRQIMYYHEMGFLSSKDDTIILLSKLMEIADHLDKQAELSTKFAFGYSPDKTNGKYSLYFNDLMTIDNIILGEYDDTRISFITNNLINVMKSTNKAFYDYNINLTNNLIARSELISGTGERVRTKTFIKIKQGIQRTIDSL